MVLMISSVAVVVLLLLVAFLFLSAPVGSSRTVVVSLIHLLLFGLIVYFVLSYFNIIHIPNNPITNESITAVNVK